MPVSQHPGAPLDAATEPPGEDRRDQTLTRIRRALLTTDLTLEAQPGSPARGRNPYDSGAQQSAGDAWDRDRHR